MRRHAVAASPAFVRVERFCCNSGSASGIIVPMDEGDLEKRFADLEPRLAEVQAAPRHAGSPNKNCITYTTD
jgi:hypothetical protein